MTPPNPTSRRQFLAAAGGTTAALAASSCSNDDEDAGGGLGGNFIDAHVHVWTPDIEKYPLAEGFSAADLKPPSFTPEELFAECKPHGVNRITLIQMSFYKFDNSYMLDSMRAHPGVFGGVAIPPRRRTRNRQVHPALAGVRRPGPRRSHRAVRER